MTLHAATWLLSLAPAAGLAGGTTPPPPVALAPQDLDLEREALDKRLKAARNDFYAKLRALHESFDPEQASAEAKAEFEKKSQELSKTDPAPAFLVEFKELAQRAKGSEVAAKCWLQVIEIDSQSPRESGQGAPETERALEVLLAEHIDSRELTRLPRAVSAWTVGEKRHAEAMRRLREKSPHRDIQAQALFALVRANMPSAGASDEQRTRARGFLQELTKDFADLPMSSKKSFGEAATAFLYELDHLQIGMLAPDFETSDENGAKFKLSDYRGKVVVLDFWGLW